MKISSRNLPLPGLPANFSKSPPPKKVAECAAGPTRKHTSALGTSHLTLKNWHPGEQPRERLMQHGPKALSTSELIAILLRTGTQTATAVDIARDLLQREDGKLRSLGVQDWRELASCHGVGKVKAVTLLAALELGRRQARERDEDESIVRSSAAAYDLFAPHLRDLKHEECWLLLLNNSCASIRLECISQGGLDSTVVDVRSVMSRALRDKATQFVIAHNHPSKNLNPSHQDDQITTALQEAGQLLRVPLRDHLIIAGNRYYSYADEGKL